MSVSSIYRIVSVLIVVFALGHTLGFNRVDPTWGVSAPIATLQQVRFTAQNTPDRTYWGFYLGFGYFCSALMVLSAALAWQLGSVSSDTLRQLQFVSWSFAAAFVAATVTTWVFFFTAPRLFSALIAIGLLVGAWRARTA
jgi:predicted membrane channel-forming protein YqfA (hemolysin III family)